MPSLSPSPSTIHDLKTLILSFHPVVAIETVEEHRVVSLVDAVAAELHLPVFGWSITQGLVRRPGSHPIHGTTAPDGLLRHLADLTINGVFHLMDLGNHLTKPSVTRQFREVAQAFSGRPATIVLSGHSLKLPDDIAHHAVHLDLALPGPREFDMDRLVTASDGFSGAEIEQATVASLYRALYAKVALNTDIILEELDHTVPLSTSRHEDIARLRETARGRFVNVH
ncbi:MAG: hypothetical protein IH876_05195 [Gemmatimonadetes bacterium]|nr:hypothetical protein [Gemmatimonadota bacterium]